MLVVIGTGCIGPVEADEGSIASTATLFCLAVRNLPNVSINVLLPAPGEPDSPATKMSKIFFYQCVT
jgi:hypothetical protein